MAASLCIINCWNLSEFVAFVWGVSCHRRTFLKPSLSFHLFLLAKCSIMNGHMMLYCWHDTGWMITLTSSSLDKLFSGSFKQPERGFIRNYLTPVLSSPIPPKSRTEARPVIFSWREVTLPSFLWHLHFSVHVNHGSRKQYLMILKGPLLDIKILCLCSQQVSLLLYLLVSCTFLAYLKPFLGNTWCMEAVLVQTEAKVTFSGFVHFLHPYIKLM